MITIEDLINNLANSLEEICNNPGIYCNETDLKMIIYYNLIRDEKLNLSKFYDTNATIDLNKFYNNSNDKYKTSLLHAEYGHNNADNLRSDLVILDENFIKSIDDVINLKLKKNKNSYVPCSY